MFCEFLPGGACRSISFPFEKMDIISFVDAVGCGCLLLAGDEPYFLSSHLVLIPCPEHSDLPLWSDRLDGDVRRLGSGSVERTAIMGSHVPKLGESNLLGPL